TIVLHLVHARNDTGKRGAGLRNVRTRQRPFTVAKDFGASPCGPAPGPVLSPHSVRLRSVRTDQPECHRPAIPAHSACAMAGTTLAAALCSQRRLQSSKIYRDVAHQHHLLFRLAPRAEPAFSRTSAAFQAATVTLQD